MRNIGYSKLKRRRLICCQWMAVIAGMGGGGAGPVANFYTDPIGDVYTDTGGQGYTD